MAIIFVNARFLTQKLTGVQRFAIEISLKLKEIDPSIVFLTPNNIIHKQVAKRLDAQVIGHFSGYIWEQLELPLYLKRLGYPLLLSLANMAPVFYKNSVLGIHDICVLRHPEWFSRKFYIAYKALIPRLMNVCKKIFTVSEFSKMEIQKHFNIAKEITVIYNAVDNQYVNQEDNNFLPDLRPYFLAVSSLSPRKNFEKIIEAYLLLEGDFNLVIVGGTHDSFPISKFNIPIAKKDKIYFPGYISDSALKTLYKNAVGLVYPSLYEGFGIPPIEAMKEHCPVIVSDNTCFREVCKDAALYVNPYDAVEISSSMIILSINQSQRESLIKKGDYVNTLYSWEKSAQKLYQLILTA